MTKYKFFFQVFLILTFLIPSVQAFGKSQREKSISFSLYNTNKELVKSSDLEGKTTVFLFLCKGLPLLQESLTQIQKVADKFPSVNVCVVALNSLNPKDSAYASDVDLRSMIRNPQIYILRDPNGENFFKNLELKMLPSLIVINSEGEVISRYEGIDPQSELVTKLRPALQP